MIQAVRNLDVPRITLMTGASFGAGNYGMWAAALSRISSIPSPTPAPA